jgi:predicted permease
MDVFILLLFKLIPLYLIIALGFVAGKYLKVSKESLASLLIYIIAPLVVFHGVYTTKLTGGTLLLPVVFFVFACVICLGFYGLGKIFFADSTKNILAFASGTGNTGYFGLPVGLAIFGPQALGPVVLCTLGTILFENTLGFFITARGEHSAREAFFKLIKLPTLYAFLLALAVNFSGIALGQGYMDFAQLFRGAYTVLGMMIIGLGIAGVVNFEFDFKFISLAFLAKFLVWPLFMLGLIFLDSGVFGLFSPFLHKIMFLISIVPIAANTVAYAALLKTHPQKAAVAVLLSTLFALVYIPILAIYFI